MRAVTENQDEFLTPFRIVHLAGASVDFGVVCLWSALGLALTGLFFALGFATEIGQTLAAAG
jgi:hypothetical protein